MCLLWCAYKDALTFYAPGVEMVEGKDLLFTKHRITETGFLKQAITDFF
jgi:hypothetical protein